MLPNNSWIQISISWRKITIWSNIISITDSTFNFPSNCSWTTSPKSMSQNKRISKMDNHDNFGCCFKFYNGDPNIYRSQPHKPVFPYNKHVYHLKLTSWHLQYLQYLQYLKMNFNPSNAEATFIQSTRIFENHLNPVMLVFIGKLLLSTLRWVPICHGFGHFSGVLLHFVLAKLATSGIRVKYEREDLCPCFVVFSVGEMNRAPWGIKNWITYSNRKLSTSVA